MLHLLNESINIPDSAQIVIFADNLNYPPNIPMGSGIARFLLKKNNIAAIFGQEEFPATILDSRKGWKYPFKGFNLSEPIIIFRFLEDSVSQIPFLLNKEKTESDIKRFNWQIYDIKSNSLPVLISEGESLDSIIDQLEQKIGHSIPESDIAFYLGTENDLIVNKSIIAEKENSIFIHSATIDTLFEILSVNRNEVNKKRYIDLYLKVLSELDALDRLGVWVNNSKFKMIPITNDTNKGDVIMIRIDISSFNSDAINISFENYSYYPRKILNVNYDKLVSNKKLILKLSEYKD
jgi:hypothetical protein